MVSSDSKSFLYKLVDKASDADLFLSHFSLCSTDEALKGNFDMSGKPVIIYGSTKRLDLAKKKLGQIYKKREIPYKEELMNFIVNEEVTEFITNNLEKLLNGNEPDLPSNEELTQVQSAQEPNEESLAKQEVEEGEEQVTASSTESTSDDKPVVNEAHKAEVSNLCQYGVPKYKIEHISPDVMGLKESLNANIDEDYIKNYFRNVVPKLTKLI